MGAHAPGGGSLPDPITDPVHIATAAGAAQLTAKFTGSGQTGFSVNTGSASTSVNVSADGAGKVQLDLIEDSNDGEVFFSTNGASLVMPRTGYTGSVLKVGIGGTSTLEASSVGLGFYGAAPVAQPAPIESPAGGATVDDAARTAIAALLQAMRNLGLIDTA